MKEAEEIIEEKRKEILANREKTCISKNPRLKRKLTFDKDRTKPNPVKNVNKVAKSDSEEDDLLDFLCSGPSADDEEKFLQDILQENTVEVEYAETQWQKLTPGLFILVNLG